MMLICHGYAIKIDKTRVLCIHVCVERDCVRERESASVCVRVRETVRERQRSKV